MSNNNLQTDDDSIQFMSQPFELKNKITTLQEKLPSILDDFKKYYVFFNKNPTYSEYQTIYENLKSNLNSITNELLTITNDVEKNTQIISNDLLKINELIEKEKVKNGQLKSIESNIENKYNGSKTMIDEYKEIYNENYIKNIFIFIGIIISGIVLTKVFSNKNISSTMPTISNKIPTK
jgi:hypothetical protein